MVFFSPLSFNWNLVDLGLPGGSVVENLPASAGDAGWIPGQEAPLAEETAAHSSILAWRVS